MSLERFIRKMSDRLHDRFLERPAGLDLDFITSQTAELTRRIEAELDQGRELPKILSALGEPADYADRVFDLGPAREATASRPVRKPRSKASIVLVSVGAVTGLVVIAAGIFAGVIFAGGLPDRGEAAKHFEKTLAADAFDQLEIHTATTRVVVLQGDQETLSIGLEGRFRPRNLEPLRVKTEGRRMIASISPEQEGLRYSELTVLLPRSFVKPLDIKSQAGRIDIRVSAETAAAITASSAHGAVTKKTF